MAYFHVSDNSLKESSERAAFLLDNSLHFSGPTPAVSPDSESRFHFTSSALHEKHKLYTTLKLIRKKKSRKPARNNVDCSSNFYREETLAVLFCWGAP